MSKQIKFALAVIAFVTTAACARAIGWYEMKDQCEKKIAVLEQQKEELRKLYLAASHNYFVESNLATDLMEPVVDRCRRNDHAACDIVMQYVQMEDAAELKKEK